MDTPLHHALGPELAEALDDALEPTELSDGATLLEAGTRSPWLYVLVEGTIEVRRSGREGPLVLGTLEPGSLVGEVGYLDDGPATATLVARGPVRLLRLAQGALPTLLDHDPRLAGQLYRRLARTMAIRLDQTSEAVLAHAPASERPPTRRARLRRVFGRLLGAS